MEPSVGDFISPQQQLFKKVIKRYTQKIATTTTKIRMPGIKKILVKSTTKKKHETFVKIAISTADGEMCSRHSCVCWIHEI